MKISYETKQKMARQREKRMRAYFNAYGIGSKIFLKDDFDKKKPESYYVLAYHELGNEFYYVLGRADGSIFIGKVVYSGYAGVIKLPKESRKYRDNKDVFDGWIKDVKENRERELLRYYHSFGELFKGKIIQHTILLNNNGRVVDAKLCLAKEHDGKYYFVVRRSSKCYLVTKLVWERGTIVPTVVTTEEFEQKKEMFESWIDEAKKENV